MMNLCRAALLAATFVTASSQASIEDGSQNLQPLTLNDLASVQQNRHLLDDEGQQALKKCEAILQELQQNMADVNGYQIFPIASVTPRSLLSAIRRARHEAESRTLNIEAKERITALESRTVKLANHRNKVVKSQAVLRLSLVACFLASLFEAVNQDNSGLRAVAYTYISFDVAYILSGFVTLWQRSETFIAMKKWNADQDLSAIGKIEVVKRNETVSPHQSFAMGLKFGSEIILVVLGFVLPIAVLT